jgi:hypothetical protein
MRYEHNSEDLTTSSLVATNTIRVEECGHQHCQEFLKERRMAMNE